MRFALWTVLLGMGAAACAGEVSGAADAGAGADAAGSRDGPRPASDAPSQDGTLPDGPLVDARPLPGGLGWIRLPGATIAGACPYDQDPVIRGVEGCSAIVNDWCGGMADTQRNRLVVWGGGHNGYYGNELYALDLGSQRLIRLNDASPPFANRDVCSPVAADGNPASRHTYDNLAYIAHVDRMFAWGGAPACTVGGLSNDTWTLDPATLAWRRMDPTTGGPPTAGISASDYDPVTHLVYLQDTQNLWSYEYETNTYRRLRSNDFTDYHLTGRIDPVRRIFLVLGNGEVHAYNLATAAYDRQDLTLTGCGPIVSAIYPGLAYDPDQGKLVGWAGGDDVYVLDLDTRSCQAVTSPGGPGPQVGNGTNGRWRYFAALRVFALVNQWDQDAFLFRLTP